MSGVTLNSKIGVFSKFFEILACDSHFKSKLRRNLHMKFSALNIDLNSASFHPHCNVQGVLRTGASNLGRPYPRQNARFLLLSTNLAWARLQIRHRFAAYQNKHCWRAFRGYQHRWPWATLKPKIAGFSEIFASSGCGTHLKSEFTPKLLEMVRPTQPAYYKIKLRFRFKMSC